MAEPRTPLISVVIPARNEEAYVEAAIASVAALAYPRECLEVIVVDNGSTDRTAVVVEEYSRRHADLSVTLVREPIVGTGRAKNQGTRIARGDVVIFLDADSRFDPRLAADVADLYRDGTPAASIRVVADSSHPLERGFFALMEVGKLLFGVRSQMMYCDRQLFLALGGFDPDLHLAEDLDLLQRVQDHVKTHGLKPVPHIRSSAIYTSPRRLRTLPFHLGVAPMFARWLLAFLGIGRTRRY